MKKVNYLNEDPMYHIHEFNLDMDAREIYLTGSKEYIGAGETDMGEPGVEFSMASQFIKNMNILMKHGEGPILIHMKTCGGDWAEGMAIYDTIKACPYPVTILNYTHARSMSSLIFSAADKRVMMPHSTFMFHDGTMGMNGTVKQFLNEAEELKKTRDQMMKIYIDVMKRDSAVWKNKARTACKHWLREHMDKKEEVYLDAKEAIKNGFADEVFDGNWEKLTRYTDAQLMRWNP